jgi:hypothetical protein
VQEEQALLAGKRGQFPARTLADAFARHEREVSPTKRGQRAERLRFTAFIRAFPHLADKVLHLIDAADLAAWRDARLAVVSASSVVQEAALLRNVWAVATREWLWTLVSHRRDVRLNCHARPMRARGAQKRLSYE